MAIRGREFGGTTDLNAMFGIVQAGTKQARRNQVQRRIVEEARGLREIQFWERPDPYRKPAVKIIKAKS